MSSSKIFLFKKPYPLLIIASAPPPTKFPITEDLILQESKSTLSMQFQQYGMVKNDEELDKFANTLLQNKEEKQRIIDQIINKKVIIYLKSKIKIKEKEVTMDDFTKLA